jgi:hypothetical protein
MPWVDEHGRLLAAIDEPQDEVRVENAGLEGADAAPPRAKLGCSVATSALCSTECEPARASGGHQSRA